MEETMSDALEKYLNVLISAGAGSGKVILKDKSIKLNDIEKIEDICLPLELKQFFKLASYNQDACDDLDIMYPEFAWGMYLLSIEQCIEHYQDLAGCGEEENPDYYPFGFLPILWNGCGDYVVINCIEKSKTFGAVYDMSEGVGCNLVSTSLSSFIDANRIVLEEKLRIFPNLEVSHITVDIQEYLNRCTEIFGNTSYFQRVGVNMHEQIVDWK